MIRIEKKEEDAIECVAYTRGVASVCNWLLLSPKMACRRMKPAGARHEIRTRERYQVENAPKRRTLQTERVKEKEREKKRLTSYDEHTWHRK